VFYPKKVGALPVANGDELKQTNEIKIAPLLLESIDIEGKLVTGDALLTQRDLARFLVEHKKADYLFTVKLNQKELHEDIVEAFRQRGDPDFSEAPTLDHGRIEQRHIWVTPELNSYLNFPHVAQTVLIERSRIDKKTGRESTELAYGITSCHAEKWLPKSLLTANRGHWSVENSCHYIIDKIYDEDRSRIRTGFGPENVSRLRRFAVGLLKSKGVKNVSQAMRKLSFKASLVLDYLGIANDGETDYVTT